MNRDLKALQLFGKASELSGDQRDDFLSIACADDNDLRKDVESLIATQEQAQGFLTHEHKTDASTGVQTSDETLPKQVFSEGLLLQRGSVLCERYTIIEKIGTGGMGDVYQANDAWLDRDVAIKVLNRASLGNAEMQNRFDREIKSVAALSHPHIVTLYDIAGRQGMTIAVMELVEGETLREKIVAGMQWQTAVKIAGDVAAALSSAHARDIMHRDIKPENIIVSTDGHAKVLDFGLARRETPPQGQELTATSLTPGTPPYMSPEQVDSKELSCSTDIFSLGTVLFEMLTGTNPFRADSALQTMNQISQSGPPRVSDFICDLPEELISLLASMLDRQCEQRPLANQVVDRLRGMCASFDRNIDVRKRVITPEHSSDDSVVANAKSIPTNLPLRSAQLTGRDSEIVEIASRLTDHAIVTVLGPGGVGKTSVAYEVARSVRNEFPGGVWLCELAPLRKAEGVLKVLAGALDGNAGTVNQLEEVVAHLQGPPTLLVIDNCEHVIDGVAGLAQTLSQQLPNLTILATSRESLNVAGEYICRVEGLSFAGALSDAATLFTKRAMAFAGYEQDASDQNVIEQIVTRLEGLPLAIELAASKLVVMSLRELLEALDNQGATLRAGRRARDRQGTINQTIAWSFDLLTPDQQEMLLTLSVFASWFTRGAAIDIGDSCPLAETHLQRLVEQSVVVRKEHNGESRYRLLEPIRQFCQSRIDSNKLAAARERHARFYAERAKVLGKGVSGFDELESADALNVEWADLREAVAWGRKNGYVEIAVDPAIALDRAAMFHLRTEVFQWLMAAEEELGVEVASRADVCAIIANGHWIMGDPESAEVYLDRSVNIAVTPQSAWVSFFLRGTQARYEEAVKHMEQAKELAKASGNEVELRWGASSLPVVLLTLIDPYDPRIEDVLSSTAELLKQVDWPTGLAMLHLAKGNLSNGRGELSEAMQHRTQAIEIASQCGSRWVELIANITIAGELDTSVPPHQQLATSIATLRSMIDLKEKSSMPIIVRSIILSIVACKDIETAARCSAVVESLRGMGDNSKLNPLYVPTMEKVMSELGEERFRQLQEEGRSLKVHDIVEIATEISDSAS